MRTTLTIDDDVEALLRQRLRESGEPLKHAINKYLRLGMIAEQKAHKRKQFKTKPIFQGSQPQQDYTKAFALVEKLNDPDWR